ncbi:DUF2383 domain-containing protein [Rhodanobacter ginsengisoli]|uniref:DUF2383 domain-containing protein n=1 Tax=Rhodanobacter ginsengisoli TaxID=418646 RepID=A0ABW0QIQ8_9GAMM
MPPRTPHGACNALIRRGIDLRLLYRQAASACEPGLRVVLNDNAQTLGLLIAELQAQLRADGGSPKAHGSWHGAIRRRLTGWLVRLASRPDTAWIHALAHQESALLQAFEQTIAALPPGSVPGLCRQLPRLRGIQLDMHSLVGSAH